MLLCFVFGIDGDNICASLRIYGLNNSLNQNTNGIIEIYFIFTFFSLNMFQYQNKIEFLGNKWKQQHSALNKTNTHIQSKETKTKSHINEYITADE